MKTVTVPQIKAAEEALEARERLLAKAAKRAAYCEDKRNDAVAKLHALRCRWREPTANDFRLVIMSDCPYFASERDMLDQVVGTYDADEACGATWQKHYASKAEWLDARAAVEAETQQWIDAYNGDGVYGWCAALEQRNRVTDEWEVIDSCAGFYSVSDSAPEEYIREQLTSDQSNGCEIVYKE